MNLEATREVRCGVYISSRSREKTVLAHIIHDGSSRNRQDATRDGRAEPREAEAYLKQYVEAARGEAARVATGFP
jgi:regulator of protease activity HflC (stomatin/prohibitin superfamily)